MTRTVTSILLTVGLLLGSWMIYKKFTSNIEEEEISTGKYLKSAVVKEVENTSIHISITSHGKLVSRRKVTLVPEASGIIRSTRLNEGVRYSKGETIFEIDNKELKASLLSLRSEFRAKLILTIPDLKEDHEEQWAKWEEYLENVDMASDLPELPTFSDLREENYMTTHGIVALYQRVKNLEIRLSKYQFKSPFDGIITMANVQEGSLVAMGQPVGEISSFGDYELELPVSIEYLPYLKVGNKLKLRTVEGKHHYTGVVDRINPRASMDAQSIIAYVRVQNHDLREGMFLEAEMDAGTIENAVEIERNLLNKDNEVFVLNEKDSTLNLQSVEPAYFKDQKAVVRGLNNGVLLIVKSPPGAYWGMRVEVLQEGK